MATNLVATVIVPTTGDRGELLEISIRSILSQTIPNLEVFIMGDGVGQQTRKIIQDLAELDQRIKFFDHPKHPRRGEVYRHQALQQAQGRIVCYLCDRDYMLPNHVETLDRLLQDADFAHTLPVPIRRDNSVEVTGLLELENPEDRNWAVRSDLNRISLPLAMVGHTLAMYNRLPYGWRTTPEGLFTDFYMWHQFLACPDCKVASSFIPTILYFPNEPDLKWSDEFRLQKLQEWLEIMKSPHWREEYLGKVITQMYKDRSLKFRTIRRYSAITAPLRRLSGIKAIALKLINAIKA